MARTRAAALPWVPRARLVFRIHDLERDFKHNRGTLLTADDMTDIWDKAERIKAALHGRGAGWDSPRRGGDAGRLLPRADAQRLLRDVHRLEHRFYGTRVDIRFMGGLSGLLSLLADELLSWEEFWDSYAAKNPAGFANNCPEPATAHRPGASDWNPDRLEPRPPTERARQPLPLVPRLWQFLPAERLTTSPILTSTGTPPARCALSRS